MHNSLNTQGLNIILPHKEICHSLSVSFGKGQFWGLLGANGSGKTTLLHTLIGLRAPSKGKIFIENRELSTLSKKQLSEKIGLLFQKEHNGFPMTVKEAIKIARYMRCEAQETEKKLNEVLATLNLMPFVNYDISKLSGGEQRRVNLARILFQDPKIYLLDEPMNHLDPFFQEKTLSFFKHLCETQNATVLMAGHNVDQMSQYCDHFLLLLGNGETLAGPAKEILCEDTLQALYRNAP